MNQQQYEKVRDGRGFFAALDQSGGSTPKALAHYGIEPDQYSGDDEMFDAMHAMRTRMITSPCFSGDRILGAILFEGTMDRDIDGKGRRSTCGRRSRSCRSSRSTRASPSRPTACR